MKKIIVLLCAVVLSACASIPVVKPDAGTLTSYQGQRLTVVTYEIPSFTAMTAGSAAFGMIGALAAISEGEKLIANNHVPDPADAMAAKLTADLTGNLKPSAVVPITGIKRTADSPAAVAKAAGNMGLVLDVQTLGWMFIYFPFDWGHYTVNYSARVRLIDGPSGKVVAQVPCTFKSDDEHSSPPTHEQLMANQAALLKEKLAKAGAACLALVEQNMLGMGLPAPAP